MKVNTNEDLKRDLSKEYRAIIEENKDLKERHARLQRYFSSHYTMLEKALWLCNREKLIFQYFSLLKVKEITVFGVTSIAAAFCVNMDHQQIAIKHLISYNDISLSTGVPDYKVFKFVSYKSGIKNYKNDTIVLALANRDERLKKELEETGANVIHILDILELDYSIKKNIDPIVGIVEQYPSTKFVFSNYPDIRRIQNKSEHEKSIVRRNISSAVLSESPEKYLDQIIPAFEQYGFSERYISTVTGHIDVEGIDGLHFRADRKDEFINCFDGFRETSFRPDQFSTRVFMFGNSLVFGRGADDSQTMASVLQRRIIEYSNKNSSVPQVVQNCANGSRDYNDLISRFPFEKNDIAILFINASELELEYLKKVKGFTCCNMQSVVERPNKMNEIFYDVSSHMNFVGYEACANKLFGILEEEKILEPKEYTKRRFMVGKNVLVSEQVALREYIKYLKNNKKDENDSVGAIVMNCNPFTLGHRYLVEKAASEVSCLYLFVVEEDRSFFPFTDRMKLVKEGVSDLKNVVVLKSGRFIISTTTFKEYFNKEESQEIQIDPTNDVVTFGEKIAPVLSIKKRYLGEEPLDKITKQYNDALYSILPQYGIKVEIIPRKNYEANPISASRVRALLEEKRFTDIRKLVPKTTYDYLVEKFSAEEEK
ncbi:MAG: hypothetical protein ACK5LL_16410 [Suipraeoptans sp.]